MRGLALIFHSMDPEALDRIEDLEFLDPESEDDDPYKEIDDMLSASQKSQPQSQYYSEPSRRENGDKEKENLGQSQSSQSSKGFQSSSLPIFNPLHSNLSSSPPLTKSDYYQDERKESQSNNQINEIMKRLFHIHTDNNNNQMTNHQHQTEGLNKEKTFTSSSGSGTALPLSRVKSCRNEISYKSSDDEEATNQTGLARFLHSLDLVDKIRQHKIEKNRFNVYNLTPQLREQLKHIYVY